MNDELLRTGDVLSLLGISRSTLDLWVSKGYFPKPHKLGPNSTFGLLTN